MRFRKAKSLSGISNTPGPIRRGPRGIATNSLTELRVPESRVPRDKFLLEGRVTRAVLSILGCLEQHERNVLFDRFCNGLTLQEMAQKRDVDIATVDQELRSAESVLESALLRQFSRNRAPSKEANAERWTTEKADRRSELIDQEIAGNLTLEETLELQVLQQEMLDYRRRVAPLPLKETRAFLKSLEVEAAKKHGRE